MENDGHEEHANDKADLTALASGGPVGTSDGAGAQFLDASGEG